MATAWLPSWSPVSSFPKYHGPYEVGTVDVEIPAADLPAPSATPEDAPPTIAFRIFYPCTKPKGSELNRPVRWIQQPQKPTLAATMKFLGIKDRTSNVASYMLQHLYYINIRAYRNAPIFEPPTSNRRYPVAFFSHGLAGSRNGYSYICGDLASSGMIVIAMDHRDGSSPVQYVRATPGREAHIVGTKKISHEHRPEVFEARDKQLRIRLWEISMAFEVLKKIDAGQRIENLDENTSRKRAERIEVLHHFTDKLDIHRLGKVSWVGHSFGAATMAQLVKSIYYSNERPVDAGTPLITPNSDAAIVSQISPESPLLLLDLWGLPLKSPDQAFLWNRALPTYDLGGSQGSNVLSVLSEGFHNWKDNLNINKHIVAPPRPLTPSKTLRLGQDKGRLVPAWARLQDQSPSRDSGYSSQDARSPVRSPSRRASGHSNDDQASQSPSRRQSFQQQRRGQRGPHMFFVEHSQHFNQSDYGVLFPFLAGRFTNAEEPQRILQLNNRVMVQVIREAGVEVAGEHDNTILDADGDIRRWVAIPVEEKDAMDEVDRKLSRQSSSATAAVEDVVHLTHHSEVQAQ